MEASVEERFAELCIKEKSTEESIGEEKQRIRLSVWKKLEAKGDIREYPSSCLGKTLYIPDHLRYLPMLSKHI